MAEEFNWTDIVVIKPNGEYIAMEGMTPELGNMQALVGGYVEVVPFFDKIDGKSCVVLCDEEGKLKGYPHNTRATLEWVKACNGCNDILVGDIVVLTGKAKEFWER